LTVELPARPRLVGMTDVDTTQDLHPRSPVELNG
jgi:hypothetical protein